MKPFIGILTLVAIMSLLGCENFEGPQGPPGSTPLSINGTIQTADSDSAGTASVSLYLSLPLPEESVTINDTIVPYISSFVSSDYHYSRYDFPLFCGDTARLYVNFTDFEGRETYAWSEIVLPGEFEIIEPDTNYFEYVIGSDFSASWTSSSSADAYELYFSITFSYYDTSGSYQYQSKSVDESFYPDTTFFISAEELGFDPAVMDSLSYGYGGFGIEAYCGPTQDGDPSNIQGNGYGFITAYNSISGISIEPVLE